MNRYPLPALLIIIVTAVLLALFTWYVVFADDAGRLSPPEWPTPTVAGNNAGPKPTHTPGPYPAPTADPYPAPYPGPSVYLPVQMESYP